MGYRIEFEDFSNPQSTSDIEATELDGKECITFTFYDNNEIAHSFWMDKSTSIKFAKTLRTEINKIKS